MKNFKNIFFIMVALTLFCLYAPLNVFAAAETVTSTAAAGPIYGQGQAGNLKVAVGTYDVTAAFEDGDIFEMVRLPAGAKIVGGSFYADDMDTGAEALELDIGWAANGGTGDYDSADVDGLLNSGVITGDVFAAGNISNIVGVNYPLNGLFATGETPEFTEPTTVQIECIAPATTFAAGTMSLVIYYTMD
jgi:hypothetical protein